MITMSMIRKIASHVFVLLTVIATPFIVAAQLQNPLGNTTITQFFNNLLDVVIMIAFPIAVLFMVYAGFLFVTAQGNQEKLSLAKKIFFWTAVGALIILGAKVLLEAIQGTVSQLGG